jgi:hypothetical protein
MEGEVREEWNGLGSGGGSGECSHGVWRRWSRWKMNSGEVHQSEFQEVRETLITIRRI